MSSQCKRSIATGFMAAIVAAACLASAPAEAGTRHRYRVQPQHHGWVGQTFCFCPKGAARAKAGTRHRTVKPWHGWGGTTFYLNGVAYRGGNPRGPAFAYNNWEGGFHPEVLWQLQQQWGG